MLFQRLPSDFETVCQPEPGLMIQEMIQIITSVEYLWFGKHISSRRLSSLSVFSSPCRLRPHKHPSAQGGRVYHRPRRCGGGRKSFLLLACSSAHRGSQLSQRRVILVGCPLCCLANPQILLLLLHF